MKPTVVGKQLTVLCIVLRLRFSSKKNGLLETGQSQILTMKSRTLGEEREEEERPEEGRGRQGEGVQGKSSHNLGGWPVWSGPALRTGR